MTRFFDIGSKGGKKKPKRFQRPEFQRMLAQARHYSRKSEPRAKGGKRAFFSLPGRLLAGRIGAFLALAVFAALLYFLTISHTFLVTSAEVLGEGISREEAEGVLDAIQGRRYLLIPENHLLLLSRTRFENALKEQLPRIRSLNEYQRVFPDKIRISAEMRTSSFVWISGEDHYLLDQDGVVYQRLVNYDRLIHPQPVIEDTLRGKVALGENLGIEEVLEFITELNSNWRELISGVDMLGASLPGTKSVDLFVETAAGFQVFFDLKRPAQSQVKNLKLLLDQEIDPATLGGLSYIDLRLPDIAYYCYKDAPCAHEASGADSEVNSGEREE